MLRYGLINEKEPREIVLLRGRGCFYKKCAFCDYHLDAGQDSIGFLGGYNNELSKIRLINMGEVTEERLGLTPGKHTMQFQRQGKYFFMLYDGKLAGWYRETSPRPAHRLGVVGIPGSNIKIYKLRVKGEK